MEPNMTILFIGKKSRTTRHGLLPIYLRVTIEGKRFEVATHQHAKPSEWSPFAGRIIGKSETSVQTNMAWILSENEFMIAVNVFLLKTEILQPLHFGKNGLAKTEISVLCLVYSD